MIKVGQIRLTESILLPSPAAQSRKLRWCIALLSLICIDLLCLATGLLGHVPPHPPTLHPAPASPITFEQIEQDFYAEQRCMARLREYARILASTSTPMIRAEVQAARDREPCVAR